MSNLALVKKDTVDVVSSKVREFQEKGELHFPDNYSPENAMKSAWLILQDIKTSKSDGYKPVLEACSKDSIANSLLDMVVQGLNPAKKQGYFIAYGKQLVFQRSYFGTMAVAKQVDDTIQDIIAEVVYEGDVFEFEINRGKKEIIKHKQTLDSINSKKIKAAYCIVIDVDGAISKTEIMTFDEIKQAWKQSSMNPVDEKGNVKTGTTHDKFLAEMAKKTVINKTCKPIINSSSDSSLFKKSFERTSGVITESKVEIEITENANSELIDVEYEDMQDAEIVEDEGPVAETTQGPDF